MAATRHALNALAAPFVPLTARTEIATDSKQSVYQPQINTMHVKNPADSISSRLSSLLGPERNNPHAETALAEAFLPYCSITEETGPCFWAVLKFSNLAQDTSAEQIRQKIGDEQGMVRSEYIEAVHFSIHRPSGFTNECFVEFEKLNDARETWRRLNDQKDRNGQLWIGVAPVIVAMSSQTELMASIFSNANVVWDGSVPNPKQELKATTIITKKEMLHMTSLARGEVGDTMPNHTMANPRRPFEHAVSILQKFPWFAPKAYTLHTRTEIFMMAIGMFNTLLIRAHAPGGNELLNMDIMERFLFAILNVPCFSVSQKFEVAKLAGYVAQRVTMSPVAEFWPWQALGRKRNWEEDVIKYYSCIHSAASYEIVLPISMAAPDFVFYHAYRALAKSSLTMHDACQLEIDVAKLMIKRSLAEATLTEKEATRMKGYIAKIEEYRRKTRELGEEATMMKPWDHESEWASIGSTERKYVSSKPLTYQTDWTRTTSSASPLPKQASTMHTSISAQTVLGQFEHSATESSTRVSKGAVVSAVSSPMMQMVVTGRNKQGKQQHSSLIEASNTLSKEDAFSDFPQKSRWMSPHV